MSSQTHIKLNISYYVMKSFLKEIFSCEMFTGSNWVLNSAKPGHSTDQVSTVTCKGKTLLGVKHGIAANPWYGAMQQKVDKSMDQSTRFKKSSLTKRKLGIFFCEIRIDCSWCHLALLGSPWLSLVPLGSP